MSIPIPLVSATAPDLERVTPVDQVGVEERVARFCSRSIKRESKIEALKLALSMIEVMLEEELYDEDFAENWCRGFDELANYTQHFQPEVAFKRSCRKTKIMSTTLIATESFTGGGRTNPVFRDPLPRAINCL